MGIEDSRNMGFDQQRHVDSILNFPSSGMNTNSTSVWDPLVSLSQSENFVGSSVVPHSDFGNSAYSVGIGNQGMVHYQPDSGLVAMVPKLPCFGSGSFSELVGSFGLNECGQINTVGCPQNYAHNQKDTVEKTTTNGGHSHGEQQISDEGGKVISPGGKGKKRIPESSSPIVHSKNGQGEQRKEISCDSPEYQTEHNEKKQKTEQNMGANLRGKQTGKQVKDSPNSGDAAKENYIHVRARRGQATNSHSLAERVRRERISERMRLLQELVPGCNKITGKAVMLDEIINYVQSLQQQVEFLSMKLATVNPELNIDLDRILSKEMLHSRGGNGTISGFGAGMNSSHLYPPGIPQGALPSLPSSSPYHPMPQNVWDNEIQSLLQMGFESNPTINTLGPSGRPKMDL